MLARTSISARRLLNLMGWAVAGAFASCGELELVGPSGEPVLGGHDYQAGPLPFLRFLPGVSDETAADQLAGLLTWLLVMITVGDEEELRASDSDLEELRARALAVLAGLGDPQELSAWDLDTLRACDLDGLRARADAGDGYAAWALAGLLADRGDLDTDDPLAGLLTLALEGVLAYCGDLDGLRARAAAGNGDAAELLAWLLADRGDLDGAVQILRARADAGDRAAAERLAGLLAGLLGLITGGDLEKLRALDLEELCARAAAGDRAAAERLAGLLADRADLDALRAGADAGDRAAAERLAGLLADRGDLEELSVGAAAGFQLAAGVLNVLLVALAVIGDLEELRARADAGDQLAGWRLADLLARHGDLEELRAQADVGNRAAAERLAWLLADRGDLDGLRARADAGDEDAGKQLAWLLYERGDLDGLRALAVTGGGPAERGRLADLLASLLIKQDRREEAERLRRFGLNPDGSTA